jgi:hypothetical protein
MSTLYLICGICGRKQAAGLLSQSSWGRLDAGPNATLRACPVCKASHEDWESQLQDSLGGGPG